jgi:tetratricopeptide (TPR) repeat protein
MLKVGELLGADYIVFGSYDLVDKDLKVEARVIRSSSSKLSSSIQASGTLDQLYTVQKTLKEGLKNYFISQKLIPSESKSESKSVPLRAYELYIKGLLEASDQEKIKFFQRAIEDYSGYASARYRLGLALYRVGKYKESSDHLAKISGNGVFRYRIDFLSGLNSYQLQDNATAVQKWFELSKAAPTAEVYNNIGIGLLLKNETEDATWYLEKAVELDSANPDYHFNYAVSLIQKGLRDKAIVSLNEAIELRPNDYQALYWLGKTLEQLGKIQPSRHVLQFFQERLPGDQKGKFPEQYPLITQMLRPAISYLSNEEKEYFDASKAKSRKHQAEYIKTYQEGARRLLHEKRPEQALLEIKKGVSFAPFDWYLHYLWGVALVDLEKRGEAVEHLQFSLWCTDNIDSHILLAELYRESEQYAAAKQHIQQILALDPKHKKAIEIWAKIANKE